MPSSQTESYHLAASSSSPSPRRDYRTPDVRRSGTRFVHGIAHGDAAGQAETEVTQKTQDDLAPQACPAAGVQSPNLPGRQPRGCVPRDAPNGH